MKTITSPRTVSQVEINSLVADVRAGLDTRFGLTMAGGWDRTEINAAIAAGAIVENVGIVSVVGDGQKIANSGEELLAEANRLIASQDASERQSGYCLLSSIGDGQEWLTEGVQVASPKEESIYPNYPGLKLQNESRAHRDGYLLYTGSAEACQDAADDDTAFARPNGSTGCWKLLVKFNTGIQRSPARQAARDMVVAHVNNLANRAGVDLSERLMTGIGIAKVEELLPAEIKEVLADLREIYRSKSQAA